MAQPSSASWRCSSVPSCPRQPVIKIFIEFSPPLLNTQLVVCDILQVLTVGALAVALGAFQQLVAVDPAVLEAISSGAEILMP